MRCSVTVWDVRALLESLDALIRVRAARAAKGVGASISLSGSSAYRHNGGGDHDFFDEAGYAGSHGVVMGEMVPISVRWRGPLIESDCVSAPRPRLYRSCAAGGRDGWRFHALSKIV
jgi:hypothetical protein